jgi:hypothetical protein
LATPERKAMVASAAERPVGRSGMGTGRFGSMSTPAKDVESGDSASSAPAFRDRYPLGSFEKEKWGGYLSSYKKDPARLLLAIAEDSVARGESGSVPLDFGPLFRPKMLLLHDADDVRDSPKLPILPTLLHGLVSTSPAAALLPHACAFAGPSTAHPQRKCACACMPLVADCT